MSIKSQINDFLLTGQFTNNIDEYKKSKHVRIKNNKDMILGVKDVFLTT